MSNHRDDFNKCNYFLQIDWQSLPIPSVTSRISAGYQADIRHPDCWLPEAVLSISGFRSAQCHHVVHVARVILAPTGHSIEGSLSVVGKHHLKFDPR